MLDLHTEKESSKNITVISLTGKIDSKTSDEFDNLAESGLLPGYLKALPYKSKILSMTKDTWIQMQASEQEDLIDDMFFKLLEYEGLYEDQDNWKDLGSGDPALAAYPVPLEFLP